MSTYAKIVSANRHKVRSLYVLAALYVAIGLGLAAVAAVNGEPLGAFLGFLIVSCTIGGTALLRAIWRLNAQAAALSDKLAAIAVATHRLERATVERDSPFGEGPGEPVQMLDLAAVGAGDPSLLAAAVLARASYPRLAQAMEDHSEPAAGGAEIPMARPLSRGGKAEPVAGGANGHGRKHEVEAAAARAEGGAIPFAPSHSAGEEGAAGSLPLPSVEEVGVRADNSRLHRSTPLNPPLVRGDESRGTPPLSVVRTGCDLLMQPEGDSPESGIASREGVGPTSNVMMRRWKTAYREGDLAACREVFSAFEPIADADLVRSMRVQLEEVVQRTERRLRLQFQQLVHEQQFEQALRVGGDIARLLPDRPVAREFERIKPYIERRANIISSPQVG